MKEVTIKYNKLLQMHNGFYTNLKLKI